MAERKTEEMGHLLKRCRSLSQLKQVHAHLILTFPSLLSTAPLLSLLIRSYLSFHSLSSASTLFSPTPPPSFHILLWNLMIQAFSKPPNSPDSSLLLFRRLLSLPHPHPDKFTFTFAFSASSHLHSPFLIKSIHARALSFGLSSDLFVGNSLIHAYSSLPSPEDAHRVFDELPIRDVVSWTSLVAAYSSRGALGAAQELFRAMPKRNEVSWAVMVAGYVNCGRYGDALLCFRDMLRGGEAKPNQAVIVCALSACAHLGALNQGRWIHVYLQRSGTPNSSNLSTALIDMYAKCGSIECAKQVFHSSLQRDVLAWTCMISGLAMNGHGKDALQVFHKMLDAGLKPDEVTLLGVLNGCSHSGLVSEGCTIFHNMNRFWGLSPKIEHYGCFIDLLSRAGLLEEAYAAIKNMPLEPDIVVWRALLSSCRTHGFVHLGEQVIDQIARLDSSSCGGGYTLLSNLYASIGRWDKVTAVRKLMNDKVDLNPGCSWIEVNGTLHEFLAADRLHPHIEEIHEKLVEVLKRASAEAGYIANTGGVLFDLSEEEREQAIAWHSEKLAVAFGLMVTPEGSIIRIVKNLRICEDCHAAMKAISLVFDREIIVRDRSRFHTFKRGSCTCADYW